MDARPADRVRGEILRLYDRNPRKWQVLVGMDDRGYTSTIFLHGGRMWILKEEPINPFESIGLGIELERIDKGFEPFLENPYSFGFRPVSRRHLKDILETGVTEKVLEEMLGKRPVPVKKLGSPAMIGPVTVPGRPIDFVSRKQAQLDRTLGKELDRLIQRKRPDLFTPYV